jgi:hypothetical protein
MLHARALALAPTADPKAKPSPTLATATATATPAAAAAAVVEGHFPRLGAEEVTQSMRACLGLARGPKVALGRLSATLGLRTRKVGKGKGNRGSGHGRKYKDHKNKVQTRNNDKHKVIFCLQIVYDIPLFT